MLHGLVARSSASAELGRRGVLGGLVGHGGGPPLSGVGGQLLPVALVQLAVAALNGGEAHGVRSTAH